MIDTTTKTVISLPYGITATIRETGAVVQCAGEWVVTGEQARGLRSTLAVIGDALECGIEPHLLNKPVAQMMQTLRNLPNRPNMSHTAK